MNGSEGRISRTNPNTHKSSEILSQLSILAVYVVPSYDDELMSLAKD